MTQLQVKPIGGALISALMIALTGCVHSQSAVSHAQRALIDKQNHYLSKYAAAIESSMQKDGTSSALVISHENTGQPPEILPTDNPVQTLAIRADTSSLKGSGGCVLFFRSDLPISPQPLSCALLGSLSQQYLADSSREKQQSESMEEVQRRLVAIAANLVTMAEQNKSLEANLRAELTGLGDTVGKQNEDAGSMRGVIGSTTKVVLLQQAEMKELRESLRIVIAGYKQSIEVVGKNHCCPVKSRTE